MTEIQECYNLFKIYSKQKYYSFIKFYNNGSGNIIDGDDEILINFDSVEDCIHQLKELTKFKNYENRRTMQ